MKFANLQNIASKLKTLTEKIISHFQADFQNFTSLRPIQGVSLSNSPLLANIVSHPSLSASAAWQ
jgi:hypothetical protein